MKEKKPCTGPRLASHSTKTGASCIPTSRSVRLLLGIFFFAYLSFWTACYGKGLGAAEEGFPLSCDGPMVRHMPSRADLCPPPTISHHPTCKPLIPNPPPLNSTQHITASAMQSRETEGSLLFSFPSRGHAWRDCSACAP